MVRLLNDSIAHEMRHDTTVQQWAIELQFHPNSTSRLANRIRQHVINQLPAEASHGILFELFEAGLDSVAWFGIAGQLLLEAKEQSESPRGRQSIGG